jgi:hypothetical protein
MFSFKLYSENEEGQAAGVFVKDIAEGGFGI